MYLMSSRFRQGGRKGRGERAGKGGTEFFFFCPLLWESWDIFDVVTFSSSEARRREFTVLVFVIFGAFRLCPSFCFCRCFWSISFCRRFFLYVCMFVYLFIYSFIYFYPLADGEK